MSLEMLEYGAEDVIALLKASGNLNAAVKNFIKNELDADPKAHKFARAFKKAALSAREDALDEFVRKYYEEYEHLFYAMARYAHSGALGEIIELAIEEYAEDFNSSYDSDEESIEIKDQDAFGRISRAVCELLVTQVSERNIPDSPFLRNVFVGWLYDSPVIPEVIGFYRSE